MSVLYFLLFSWIYCTSVNYLYKLSHKIPCSIITYTYITKEGFNLKYEVLIFDADETLFDFKKAEKYALENAIKDFNICLLYTSIMAVSKIHRYSTNI